MASRMSWPIFVLGLLLLLPAQMAAQNPPTGGSQTPPTTTQQTPPPTTQETPPDRQERPRGEGRRGRGDGEGRSGAGRRGRRGSGSGEQEARAPRKPREGIKVTDSVVIQHCGGCHKVGDDGLMSRVSFMRKGPEGWEMSLNRMIRHHDMKFSP